MEASAPKADPLVVEHRLTAVEFELKQLSKGMGELRKDVRESVRLQRQANGNVATLQREVTAHKEHGEGCPLVHRVEALEGEVMGNDEKALLDKAYARGVTDTEAKVRKRTTVMIGGVTGLVIFSLDVIDKLVANIVPWLNGK